MPQELDPEQVINQSIAELNFAAAKLQMIETPELVRPNVAHNEGKAVPGSILNLVDANFVDSDPTKPQRQLYGYSIAAKRYALYEKTGKSNITIVDPKAHGIGFLYPPHDSPKNWNKDVPLWIYQLWDYIVRGALKLPRKPPSWLDIPQMMRLTITTYNVLEMLGEWEIARPYNFLLLPMVDPVYGIAFHRQANEKVLLVSAFSSKQPQWFAN